MNFVEKKFINILKAYVNGEKINVVLDNKEIWEKFLEESREHCVDGIVYSTIKWDDNTTPIDENLKNSWKNRVFSQGIWQIKHIKKTCSVFNEFNKQGIEFVALKGFIIRNFYKSPEHRIMGDIDILVHEDDLEKTSNCLENLGYKRGIKGMHHIDFVNSGTYHKIEVHWTLVNKNYFKGEIPLEYTLWKNVKKVNINDVELLEMSIEDMLVHLCLHMAVHLTTRGFGIRHLLDIALIVKSMNNNIDWKKFKEQSKKNNIEKFSYLVFLMCETLFDVDIPKELNEAFNVKKEEVDIFIADILKSGVHGKRDSMVSFKAQIAFDSNKNSASNNLLKGYLKVLFPSGPSIGVKYNYAKKFRALLPIAWIHRLFNGILNKEFNLKEKINFFTVNILESYRRNKLLKWLEL